MAELPYYYDYVNAATSSFNPSTVHCKNTALHHYFSDKLLQKAMAVFKWTLPDGWAENYFKYVLYCHGYIGIIETDTYGVIPQQCTLYGYDVQYQPTNILVTNPLINSTLNPRIGLQCALIKLQPNYRGIMDIVSMYADLMALAVEAVGFNFINSKLAYIFAADGKAQAETFKKLYDTISSGNPAAVVDKNLFNEDGSPRWQFFTQNLSQQYIADKLMIDLRKIENDFSTQIGIPNANTEKKERLLKDEVNSNNFETQSRADMWLDELQKGCKQAKDIFGIDISVKWRTVEGGIGIEQSNSDDIRSI